MLDYNRWNLFILFALVIIVVNVKATMLAFAVILCAGFLLVLFLQKDKRYMLKSVLVTSLVAGAVGVFIFGFNPYVTTYLRQHSVFYGLSNVKDEIDRLTPMALRGHNRMEKLAFSTAAHSGWPDDSHKTFGSIAKLPLAFNKNDILEADDVEAGLSGFGPFYSGALLIALIAFCIAAFNNARTKAFCITGIALLFITATVLIVPDSWWTRFVPQLWLLPAVVLLMLSFISFKGSSVLRIALTATMTLSILWGSLVFVADLLNNARIDHQLAQLKALNKPVHVEYCDYRNFKSNQVRLAEAGIPLSAKMVTGDDECDVPFSTTHIQTPGPLPDVPGNFLYKLRSKLSSSAK
jgi:energy-coupling factor transporter transmembrane protein EcfT